MWEDDDDGSCTNVDDMGWLTRGIDMDGSGGRVHEDDGEGSIDRDELGTAAK